MCQTVPEEMRPSAWLFNRTQRAKEMGLEELPHDEKPFCLTYELAIESPQMQRMVAAARQEKDGGLFARKWDLNGIPDPTFVFDCPGYPRKHWMDLSRGRRKRLIKKTPTGAPIIGSSLMEQILGQWEFNLTQIGIEDRSGAAREGSELSDEQRAFFRMWEVPKFCSGPNRGFVWVPTVQPYAFYALIEIDPRKSRRELRADFDVALQFHKQRKSPEWYELHNAGLDCAKLKEHFFRAKKRRTIRKNSYIDRLEALGAFRLKTAFGSPRRVKESIGKYEKLFVSDRVFYSRATVGGRMVAAFNRAVTKRVSPLSDVPF